MATIRVNGYRNRRRSTRSSSRAWRAFLRAHSTMLRRISRDLDEAEPSAAHLVRRAGGPARCAGRPAAPGRDRRARAALQQRPQPADRPDRGEGAGRAGDVPGRPAQPSTSQLTDEGGRCSSGCGRSTRAESPRTSSPRWVRTRSRCASARGDRARVRGGRGRRGRGRLGRPSQKSTNFFVSRQRRAVPEQEQLRLELAEAAWRTAVLLGVRGEVVLRQPEAGEEESGSPC